ncbi:MAG: hypothetical protein EXR31_10485 [Betaproteobacteria bacterium]|nr:hypothetical protein [Betaproteobacteria bacterium]
MTTCEVCGGDPWGDADCAACQVAVAEFIDGLAPGASVRVVLPDDVAPWWTDECGVSWDGVIDGMNGDSADVSSPGGIEPVDVYLLRPAAWLAARRS